MKYIDFKHKQDQEFNAFTSKYMFFAFSNDQFENGLKKLNCTKNDIVSTGMGGLILKSKVEDFKQLMITQNRALKNMLKTNKEFCIDAFNYELSNHEYIINHDIEPILNTLGISLEQFQKSKYYQECMKVARNAYMSFQEKNGYC